MTSRNTNIFASFLLLISLALPVWAEKPTSTKLQPRSAATSAERQWQRLIPTISRSNDERWEIVEARLRQLVHETNKLTTSNGIDAFLDEAMGWKSAGQAVTDSAAHKAWIRKQFVEYVYPVSRVEQLVIEQCRLLDAELQVVDDKTLIQTMTDSNVDTSSLRVQAIDALAINREIKREIDRVIESVHQALLSSTGKVAAGIAGEEITRQLALETMRDERGEVSIGEQISALIIGGVAGWAIGEVADEVVDTRGTLRKAVLESVERIHRACFVKGNTFNITANRVGTAVKQHNSLVASAIIRAINVDPAWAIASYNHAVVKQ